MTKLSKLPCDYAAEAAVVASIIIGPEKIPTVIEHIGKDDFVCQEAAILFEIAKELWRKGQPVDGLLVRSEFANRSDSDMLLDYLRKALDTVPSSANAVFYAEIIRRKSIERKLIRLIDQAMECATDPSKSLSEKLSEVNSLLRICPEDEQAGDITLTDLVDQYFLKRSESGGIPTGLSKIDQLLDGLKPGYLVLIAGPTSIGKTSLLLDMFIHAMRLGTNPYLVSLEMLRKDIVDRMVQNIARVQAGFDKRSNKVVEALKFIGQWPGSLADKPPVHIEALTAHILSKQQRERIGIVFVDHFHLINAPGRTPYERATYTSRALKSLAMQAEIPVVVAAQLNRAPRHRSEHRPFLSDLRDSGSLEQDADVVMLLYSEDYYRRQDDPKAKLDGAAECILAKNRNRPTGIVQLIWLPEFSTFEQRIDDKWYE